MKWGQKQREALSVETMNAMVRCSVVKLERIEGKALRIAGRGGTIGAWCWEITAIHRVSALASNWGLTRWFVESG